MLLFSCKVDVSTIPNAGKGLFADQFITKGSVIAFPGNVQKVLNREQLLQLPEDSAEFQTSVRWFDNHYASDPEHSDIYYINHAFSPNCIWHLGFIFALQDIAPGSEITLDYRVLMDSEPEFGFKDETTGQMICGYSWTEKMISNTTQLLQLFKELAEKTGQGEAQQTVKL